tara:strand:+ start:134 stop:319 length:186 start_codon:yes stop_codon:yes gene_type:complete
VGSLSLAQQFGRGQDKQELISVMLQVVVLLGESHMLILMPKSQEEVYLLRLYNLHLQFHVE